MSQQPNYKNNALTDIIAAKIARDNIVVSALSLFLVFSAITSLLTGIVIWSVVQEVSVTATKISQFFSQLYQIGWIAAIACAVLSFLGAIFMNSSFSLVRTLIFNMMLAWLIATIGILTQDFAQILPLTNSFAWDVLKIIFASILGYFLAVLPAILATVVAYILYLVAEVIWPD